MRLTDSAIDRVWIFASANQCVILTSASMDVTVCPARCLGPIMEPSSTNGRAVLRRSSRTSGSAADRNEPAPQSFAQPIICCNPRPRHSRSYFLESVELVREAVMVEARAPATHVNARRSRVWPLRFKRLPLRLLSSRRCHFSVRIPAAECMIGRDRVVNSRDLHAAKRPGRVEQAACRSCSTSFNCPRGVNGRTRCPASEFHPHAICW